MQRWSNSCARNITLFQRGTMIHYVPGFNKYSYSHGCRFIGFPKWEVRSKGGVNKSGILYFVDWQKQYFIISYKANSQTAMTAMTNVDCVAAHFLLCIALFPTQTAERDLVNNIQLMYESVNIEGFDNIVKTINNIFLTKNLGSGNWWL